MTRPSDLIETLPAILRNNAEFNAIFETEADALDTIQTQLTKAQNDQYIDTATLTAINRWEKMLAIRADTLTETLEQRRARIKAKLLERLPFTIRTLREKLTAILGDIPFVIDLDHNAYQIALSIESQHTLDDFYYQQIDDTLQVMLPANLAHHLQLLRKLTTLTIYLGCTTQTGTELRIYPILNDELTAQTTILISTTCATGAQLTIYPKE